VEGARQARQGLLDQAQPTRAWALRTFPAQKEGERIVFVPQVYDKPRKKSDPPKPPSGSLTLRDIVDFRCKIDALSVAILNWNARASGKKEPYPISSRSSV